MNFVKVGSLCRQVRGVSYSKSDASLTPQRGFVPVLRATNIVDGEVDLGELVYVPKEKVKKEQLLKTGDVLIAASSGSINIVGKAARVRKDLDAGFGAFCKVLRPNDEVDAGYFNHFFQTRYYRHTISHLAAGANINNLRNEHIENLDIALPPLAEQRRIAAILDQADALRQQRRRSLARLDDLLQSVFLEMFGDPVTNPMGWEVKKFGEVGTLERGKSKHRPRNAPELLGGPYPLIQTGDVSNSGGYITEYNQTYSEIGLAQSRIWEAGVLCITIAANIANTGILTFDACFPDSVVGFLPNELVRTEYVQHWLSFLQAIIEETAPAVAQKNINLKILRDLDVPVPPIELQDNFVRLVRETNKIKSNLVKHEQTLGNLFSSLQQRAFRGELQ